MEVVIPLADRWHEIPGETPRAFRRPEEESGWLQISLHPPQAEAIGNSAKATALLKELLKDQKDLGEECGTTCMDSAAGIMAVSVWKSPKRGLLQFWLIPCEVAVFASYTMGNPARAKQEAGEAHQMMKGL